MLGVRLIAWLTEEVCPRFILSSVPCIRQTRFYDFQARYSPVIAWLINTDDGFGLNWHIMMHLNPLVLRLKEKCKNTIHEEQSSRIDLTVRFLSYWQYSGIRSTTHLKTAKSSETYIHLNILSQREPQLSYIREYNPLSPKSNQHQFSPNIVD